MKMLDRITIYQKEEKFVIDPSNPFKTKEETEGKTYSCYVRVVNDYKDKLPTGLKTGKTIKVHLRSNVPKFEYAVYDNGRFEEVGRSYGLGRDITITMERVGGVANGD